MPEPIRPHPSTATLFIAIKNVSVSWFELKKEGYYGQRDCSTERCKTGLTRLACVADYTQLMLHRESGDAYSKRETEEPSIRSLLDWRSTCAKPKTCPVG